MSSDPFLHSKIFEQLDYSPEPEGYTGKVPWKIQQQIAATNGIHYVSTIGQLKEIPTYEMPVPKVNGDAILLDIGNGWGRWLSAGASKGYIPVGIDMRHEFCVTAIEHLTSVGKNGYAAVADLEYLPFSENTFDVVWSFSVIQHTHKRKLDNCLNKINDILAPNGMVKIQFPSADGIRNRRVHVNVESETKDDINSWCVRYYSVEEYKAMYKNVFGNEKHDIHSFFGIGVLKEDLGVLTGSEKFKSALSLAATKVSNATGIFANKADSYYFSAIKKGDSTTNPNAGRTQFLENNRNEAFDNLNVVNLLACPISGGALTVSEDRLKCISTEAKVAYPIVDNVPVIVKSESTPL